MKNIIVSNLAPITENDLTFFMELEKSLNSLDYKVYFWSCIQVPEFENYIQMAWDITKWERFGEKLSQKQKEIARLGGIASGKARRRKKALKELCMYQLNKQLMIEGWLESDIADFREWQKQKRKAARKKK